ncbi:MAG TPA: sulfatase-like hydrolase/transferase, partial [Bacteroidia bacterium]|nr:sulfatase-like hydrolase/transferase [Bacteroidia bacterium]
MKYLSPYSVAFKVVFTALAAFTIYRLFFLGFNHHSIPEHPEHAPYLYYRSFILGVNFDLVIICYLLAPFAIFLFIRQLTQQSFEKGLAFFKWYFSILFSICLFICAADIPYFKQFATHLNRDTFNWASSPGLVFKLIFSSFSYWGFLILFVLLVAFIYTRFSKIFSKIHAPQASPKWKSMLIFLFLAFFTFIGMRGRTALKSPIRIGTAFFSEHAFFNQLGLNPCFVFFQSLKQEKEWDLLVPPVEQKELTNTLVQLNNRKPTTFERTYKATGTPLKYNVMLVLMESMSMTKMGHHHCTHLTNRFDTIAHNGLFFDNFYSSGIHTFNGLFSTETGFPSILNTQPLETYTDKAFKGISYWLKQNGYSTYFFTSNDGQFDNMEGFMKFNHFEHFYSHEDFPSDKAVSTMGVPDHYLLEFALKKMDAHLQEKNTPFFSYILTSSDHG